MNLKKSLSNVAKVAGVLAINAVILQVITADEAAPTRAQEASADIADFMPKEVFAPSSTTDIVKGTGLTPRKFNINGSDVYHAVGETSMSPRQVLEFYQTEFVAAGVNSKKYLESPQQKINGDLTKLQEHGRDASKMIEAMTNGEVVPYMITDDYVSMGGPVIKADTFKEIVDEWGPSALKDPNRIMKGWRFIDARKKRDGSTEVMSIWADKDFDFKKFREPNGAQLGLKEEIPACPSCTLLMRSSSDEDPMAVDQYSSPHDSETVADYYRNRMRTGGWELSDTSVAMEHAASMVPDHPFNTKGRMLTFARGNEFVTYTILPSDDGTIVTANHAW